MTTTVSPAVRPLVRHGFEMLAAMLIGMALLGPLWTPERVELAALWMAVSMSVPDLLLSHEQVLAALPQVRAAADAISEELGWSPAA